MHDSLNQSPDNAGQNDIIKNASFKMPGELAALREAKARLLEALTDPKSELYNPDMNGIGIGNGHILINLERGSEQAARLLEQRASAFANVPVEVKVVGAIRPL